VLLNKVFSRGDENVSSRATTIEQEVRETSSEVMDIDAFLKGV